MPQIPRKREGGFGVSIPTQDCSELGSIHRAERAPGTGGDRAGGLRDSVGRRKRAGGGRFSPRGKLMSSSNQYKKPTSIFFISWVFFRLLKRKKF